MKRCPRVVSPARSPSISSATTSLPASVASVQRIPCSGRTQRRLPSPQRIDFGQGKPRTIASTVSATISAAGRPGRCVTANQTCDFLSSRTSRSSRLSPVERRNPSSAFSGASTRGPLRSSRLAGERAASPSTASVSRRGVTSARASP